METRRWVFAGILFGILWVFVAGPNPTPVGVLGSFLLGTAVGFPVAYVFRRLYADRFELGRLTAVVYILLYVLTFAREVVVANIDMTYRILAPSMPIHPEVIMIPLRVQTDIGITTIANSITLTPGTLTMDYDEDENALYVHTIDGRNPMQTVAPIREWEDYALRIFDEERSPGDPSRGVRVHPTGHTEALAEEEEAEEGTEVAEETEVEQQAGAESNGDARPPSSDGEDAAPTGPDDGTDIEGGDDGR